METAVQQNSYGSEMQQQSPQKQRNQPTFNYYDPAQFQMYYNQYFQMPYSQYHHYQYYSSIMNQQAAMAPQALPPGVTTACRSLYIGNLSERVSEPLLYEIFSSVGPVESCKLIKDKMSGESSGYGFMDYYEHRTAALALQSFNGRFLYGHELKVNWAFANGQKEDTANHHHIFVGDLSLEVDDKILYAAFAPFGSLSDARVMTEQGTNKSRGYGFVAFRKREDAQKALIEMNGEWLGTRAIRCNWANQKGNANPEDGMMGNGLDYNTVLIQAPPSNTTVYVGNVTPDMTEPSFREIFAVYGVIDEVRLQPDRGFAFVRYHTHESAAKAIVSLSGRQVGGRIVKCAWGKDRPGLPMMAGPFPRMN
eukprot:TRINITY_DN3633_c0_g1_i1.p1 TRINITY_DN3633_c0_g1~~TRINITY_DN3633_c0_g1_i1.p1  ORF type:complete len:365 (+),score=66.47 TRINITY_DN3633_c0_g1_i1:73-1167(+)